MHHPAVELAPIPLAHHLKIRRAVAKRLARPPVRSLQKTPTPRAFRPEALASTQTRPAPARRRGYIFFFFAFRAFTVMLPRGAATAVTTPR